MTRDQCIRVQTKLKELGLYMGRIDGISGPATRVAVQSFQKDAALEVDGIVGPKTWRALFSEEKPAPAPSTPNTSYYVGAAIPLSPGTVVAVAGRMMLEAAALQAVIDVESNGKPFGDAGRPTVLYEPHIAYRLTQDNVRNQLLAVRIASRYPLAQPPGEKSLYPLASITRYQQVDACGGIAGKEIAAQASSWGMGQIMGFNHASVGYMSAVEMVQAFAADAANQIAAMAAFILNNSVLHFALMRHDWATFAEGYNGSHYRDNAYDKKLATAYATYKIGI